MVKLVLGDSGTKCELTKPSNSKFNVGEDMKACDESVKRTIELTRRMLDLADEGDSVREDTGCGVLFGVLRDSAYRVRRLAETEREAHKNKGWWKESE